MTSESSPETRQAAREAGALFVITRPLTASDLAAAPGPLVG